MEVLFNGIVAAILLFSEILICDCARERHIEYYSNQWVVKVEGEIDAAKKIAEIEGFEVREIPEMPDTLIFEHPRHPKKAAFRNHHLTNKLMLHDEVIWASQVETYKRQPRNIMCPRAGITTEDSRYALVAEDKMFTSQWYMQDCRKDASQGPTYDINIIPVWYEYKLLGYGIIVLIVDDGVEISHQDLATNYDSRYGLDLVDGNATPQPVHTNNHIFNHGTKCAGVVGMIMDNGSCGVGVAPLVTLGAVRLLGNKPSNDVKDARALRFKAEEIDISSNSWGPTDDGKTLAPMGELTRNAIQFGIERGRQGKGVIYIYAGGNGKTRGDMCGCDPFVSSIYTIAVASCNQLGKLSMYSERCASIMITAYSGDKTNEFNVISSDVFNGCTNQHSGTSASTPLVAGGLTVSIEANSTITWREAQFLLVLTSEVSPLDENAGWQRNKAGLWVSHDFGFGLLNIREMVKHAKHFSAIPPMRKCVEEPHTKQQFPIKASRGLRIEITGTGCLNTPNEINYLEHVQVNLGLTYSNRGHLEINLISPMGTISHLLERRPEDNSVDGIPDWTFDTVMNWGESPKGKWAVEILDSSGSIHGEGILKHVTLILYGTKELPAIYRSRRTYYQFHGEEEQSK